MEYSLKGKKIAILATDGVEQSELTLPRKALEEAGAKTELISINPGEIKAWNKKQWGDAFQVDKIVAEADPHDYDALLIPGGVMNPDQLRISDDAIDFAEEIYDQDKPIAAICHGPWMLIEIGAAEGREMTAYPSLRSDLINAGAFWEDEPVVVDEGIVTSRTPDDIKFFNEKMIEEFAEGKHAPREAGANEYIRAM